MAGMVGVKGGVVLLGVSGCVVIVRRDSPSRNRCRLFAGVNLHPERQHCFSRTCCLWLFWRHSSRFDWTRLNQTHTRTHARRLYLLSFSWIDFCCRFWLLNQNEKSAFIKCFLARFIQCHANTLHVSSKHVFVKPSTLHKNAAVSVLDRWKTPVWTSRGLCLVEMFELLVMLLPWKQTHGFFLFFFFIFFSF